MNFRNELEDSHEVLLLNVNSVEVQLDQNLCYLFSGL